MTVLDEIHNDHPAIDRTNRFAIDRLLRDSGFKIYSRCSGQQPMWERYGDRLTQDEALQSLIPSKVKDAQKKEDDYFEQFLRNQKTSS